jgi:hypothetical protein
MANLQVVCTTLLEGQLTDLNGQLGRVLCRWLGRKLAGLGKRPKLVIGLLLGGIRLAEILGIGLSFLRGPWIVLHKVAQLFLGQSPVGGLKSRL